MKNQIKFVLLFVLSFLVLGAHASPIISGSSVTFPTSPGWYQIQTHDWSNVCENGAGQTCTGVPDGDYYVTNLRTAQRWNITVGGGSSVEIPALNTVVENELTNQNVLGGAVAVVRNGRIVHARGYGFTSPTRTTRVTTDTVFRWASISKTLTAVAALQLDEQPNNFEITDNVTEHFAGWPTDPTDNRSQITIEQLLAHRSGITHYRSTNPICLGNSRPDFNAAAHGNVPFNANNAVNVFRNEALCFNPGTSWRYSTFGYSLAAAALEAEAGQNYTQWVENNIATPLNMNSLTQGTGTSVGYNGECGDTLTRARVGSKSYVLPGGGWASNIRDLALFANGILQSTLLRDTDRLWTDNPGNSNRYRLGLSISTDGTRSWSSGGHADLRTFMHLYHGHAENVGIVVYLNNAKADPELVAKLVANEIGIASWGVAPSACP